MAAQVEITPLKDTVVFEPIKVGKNELSNRIVHAPTTRFRSLEDHSPSNLNLEYYDSRTKTKGSFVITEATYVGAQAGGYPNIPGIWTDNHVKAWKKITDRVHANGSFIGVQAWFLGRVGYASVLKASGQDLVAPSAVYPDEEAEKGAIEAGNLLRAVTEEEIHDLIYNVYTNAAKKAIEAGFDYFELHGAHGYFLDTFLHPSSNKRTDKYGGSIENRARFVLELIDHLTAVIGADKLAIRLSPWASFGGVKGAKEEVHPIATHGYLVNELQKRADAGKGLAYVSIVEPRVNGNADVEKENQEGSNEFIEHLWKGIVLKSGNYTYDAPKFEALKRDTANKRTLIGFSRFYTSNPDLVDRLYHGNSLEPYNRPTFYEGGNWRYNTYNKYEDETEHNEELERKNLPKEIAV